jgi:hypothetical protein
MTVEDLTPSIVRQFLDHLERDRHCSGVTRNQRLAMIHSLARFIGTHSPVHLAWCTELRARDEITESKEKNPAAGRNAGKESGVYA